ncbi:YfhO family protein [Bacillus velezensis]|nr:YfhO family protein [Bacillus velezensis]
MIRHAEVAAEHGDYHNGILTVNEDGGGLIITPQAAKMDGGDYYVSFYLKNKAKDQGFTLKVNDYTTTRKSNQSIYKTGINDLTVRVPKTKTSKSVCRKDLISLTDWRFMKNGTIR